MSEKNISILRIIDVAKAKEFYIDWLGFKNEFEHQFEENKLSLNEYLKEAQTFYTKRITNRSLPLHDSCCVVELF